VPLVLIFTFLLIYETFCYEQSWLFTEFTPTPSAATIFREDSQRQKVVSRRQRTSTEVLAMMGELAFTLTQQVTSKSAELQRLNHLIDNMQVLCLNFFYDTVCLNLTGRGQSINYYAALLYYMCTITKLQVQLSEQFMVTVKVSW